MAQALEQRWEADRVREAERAGQPDTAVRLQPSKARLGSTFGGACAAVSTDLLSQDTSLWCCVQHRGAI